MQLRRTDIEPVLAERINAEEARLESTVQRDRIITFDKPFPEAIRQREKAKRGAWMVVSTAFLLLMWLLVALASFFGAANRIVTLAIGMSGAISLILANRYFQQRITQNTEAQITLLGLSAVAQGRLETLYADLVGELVRAGGENQETARRLLGEVNALVSAYRKLDGQRADNKKAMGTRSVEGLTAELRDLRARAEAATDPATRHALEQSAKLCAGRIESFKALVVAQERIAAQQEVVLQTLASVQAAFAHLRAAPGAEPLAVEQIAGTVSQLQTQTHAVEQAVAELMTVGGER